MRHENKKTENHDRQRLATLERLKQGVDNEFERNLRLEKVVSRKKSAQVGRRQKKTEEQNWRMMQLPHYSGWPWSGEESKARLEKMVAAHSSLLAMIKGVINVGAVLSSNPFL